MAFAIVEKMRRGNRTQNSPDVYISKNEKQGSLQVSIPVSILEPLGLAKGDSVTVAIGSGEDNGWIRVTKSTGPSGFKLGYAGGVKSRLKFGSAMLLRNIQNLPTTSCRHVVAGNALGNALLIEIPSRLLNATLSVAA